MSQKDKKSTFIIAEVGQAHDGSLGILHSYIDAVSQLGVDAIKFQTHIASAESSAHEPFRVNFSYVDKTRFDYWQRMEFTKEQWVEIKRHCDEVDLEFISSPFSCAAVDLLEEIGVKRYKIGSGEVSNNLMLDKIAKTGKQIILSSGMSTLNDISNTISRIKKYHNDIVLMQCTSNYPVEPHKLGLNVLNILADKFKLPTGLSDHSGTIYPSIAATALGSKYIEAHVVFDKQMFGPDSKSSLSLKEFGTLVEGVRYIDQSINSPVDKNDVSDFKVMKSIFEKSLSVNKELSEGHILTIDDLESKKPAGMGIPASEYETLIGKKLSKNLACWSFITKEDLINE